MASSSSAVASSVDVLTPVERSIVCDGLNLRIAQLKRLINSERDFAIRDIRENELSVVSSLVLKFR
jgi:hypothetical protein